MAESIKVYSTSTCPYCRMLKGFLEEKNVIFENIDVGSDSQAA
ncbi:glutaredoxin family protein, partial [bacterium]|nr:glutaredoxin family protein [bacterium]